MMTLGVAAVPKLKSAVQGSLKVALDGGTRPGDTLQILPLALAQPPKPPLYYLPLCAQGDTLHSPTELVFSGAFSGAFIHER